MKFVDFFQFRMNTITKLRIFKVFSSRRSDGHQVPHEFDVSRERCHMKGRPAIPRGQPWICSEPDERGGHLNVAAACLTEAVQWSNSILAVFINVNLIVVLG